MSYLRHSTAKPCTRRENHLGENGVSAIELALIIPLILMMLFAIIDLGRFIQARIVITNLAREGWSLASREIKSASDLITMLQNGSSPLDLETDGKIYIWKIKAGISKKEPDPYIDDQASVSEGGLSAGSSIGNNKPFLGLSSNLYQHLVYKNSNKTADISEVNIVEVFYRYTLITPLSIFIPITNDEIIMSSKAGS
jgi:hypothetical protein